MSLVGRSQIVFVDELDVEGDEEEMGVGGAMNVGMAGTD